MRWECSNASGIPHLTPTLSAPGGGEEGIVPFVLRLGFRQIKGFSESDAERLVDARGQGYESAEALWRQSGLGRLALERLAAADALRSLTLDRRQGLWALKALGEAPLPLFAAAPSPSPAMREREGPGAQRWEGEGRSAQTLTRLAPVGARHPLPPAGEGR